MLQIKIIDHRGAWCNSLDQFDNATLQNSYEGFLQSFKRGHGAELDLRDYKESLIVSHDLPKGEELAFEKLLKLYTQYKDTAGTLAINIKSDGLQRLLKSMLELYNIENYFVFDMSTPDTLKYLEQGLKSYIRHSEYEIDPEKFSPYLYKNAEGIWLDQFFPSTEKGTWITRNIIKKHLDNSKKVVIVSPELHPWGRNKETKYYTKIWEQYKKIFFSLKKNKYCIKNISLCTDFPLEAEEFFTKISI